MPDDTQEAADEIVPDPMAFLTEVADSLTKGAEALEYIGNVTHTKKHHAVAAKSRELAARATQLAQLNAK